MAIGNQPIIFDLKYTPYRPPKGATDEERKKHSEERAFYDMTGVKNVYGYITTEGKRTGKFTALDYLQKNTGVFNASGMISQEEVDAMRIRLSENKGHIWHGFISLNEEDSPKIDTSEKCIAMVKSTFGSFFREAHLNEKNMDLMCALHLDRPHHLHIHFVFWEKTASYKCKSGEKQYRVKGKIQESAIDNMFVRLGLFIDDDKSTLYKTRDEAIRRLRGMTAVKVAFATGEEIKNEIIALSRDLPKVGRLSYGSKDMESYRGWVDNIVQMLLNYDGKARRANKRFYQALAERKRKIENICGQPYALAEGSRTVTEIEKDLPKYHHKINLGNIKIIEEIEADYKRRQGNLVLGLAKFIKPELFKQKPCKKYKTNDNFLKRRLNITRRNVDRAAKKFIASFGRESELLERDFTHRLQDIQEEIRREREKENEKEEIKRFE